MQRRQSKIVSEIRKYKTKRVYKKVHIITNPASGKNEPILNVINSVFSKHDIDWSISVTKKFGDATRMAKKAAKSEINLMQAMAVTVPNTRLLMRFTKMG